ncbi:MAG: hypothetical protein ABIQ53_16350 [Terracoccus sp.]
MVEIFMEWEPSDDAIPPASADLGQMRLIGTPGTDPRDLLEVEFKWPQRSVIVGRGDQDGISANINGGGGGSNRVFMAIMIEGTGELPTSAEFTWTAAGVDAVTVDFKR